MRQTANRTGLLSCRLLLICVLLTGCIGKQPQQPRPAVTTATAAENFGGEWWELYKRGLFLTESERYREAMADFREAIARRDQDQWQAEIGSGRALDYFPHRELGIRHVARQEYDKAILELENSIATAPSAKASFFLNKARAGKFARDAIDRSPPEIHFAGSTAEETTSSCSKIVTGVASDDTFLAALSVDGRPVPLTLAEKHKVFKTEVALAEGQNSIRVVATDLAGKTTEKALEIYCDRRGPQIEIDHLTVGDKQTTISGFVSDDHQMGSLAINGRPWPVTGKAPGYNFNFTLPEGRITIVASDRAGNVTGARVRRDEFDLSASISPPQAKAENDTASDIEPPTITLEGLGARQETSAETILLTGQISDSSLLVYISINGEQILNRRGRRIYFSQVRPLEEGKNIFHLIAADEYGNKTSQTISVSRRSKPVRQLNARLCLALLPFAGSAGTPGADDFLLDHLRRSFIDQGRFNLVEQEHIFAASRAFHLSPGGAIAPKEAAAVGQAVGAQAVLTGRVLVDPDGVEVVGQLIDATTATLLTRIDTYGEAREEGVPSGLPADLAARLAAEFPLVEGALLEIREQEVLVDLGARHRIRPLTRLLCYREGPPALHPVTGERLESELEIIGELLVTEVGKDSSRAAVVTQTGEFLRGDRVITR
jgi:TolB-like protein